MTLPLSMLHLCHYYVLHRQTVIQMFLQTHVYNLCSYQMTPKYNALLDEALCHKLDFMFDFSLI